MATNLGLFPSYCMDANVFFEFWSGDARKYSKEVFKSAWDHIELLISQGRIFSPIEVYDEVKLHTLHPDFQTWLAANKKIFVPMDAPQVASLSLIVNKYPSYTKAKKSKADPFVVALAHARGLSVLTLESRVQAPSPFIPKIPNLCQEFGVDCVNVVQLFQREGVQF